MSRYCLDTSAYAHFKRGHGEVVRIMSEAAWIGVPAIVLGELRHGFLLGNRAEDNERALMAFLHEPRVEVQVVDAAASRQYAEIVVELKSQGTPIPTNDAWVAALGARDGATVLTFDTDFAKVRRVGSRVLHAAG